MDLSGVLYPARCPSCGQLLQKGERWLCRSCRKSLPRVTGAVCMRCGKPVMQDTQEYCRDCSRKREKSLNGDPLTQGTALFCYNDSMKRIMAEFKYNGCYHLAVFFAEELMRFRGDRIREWRPDYIIPVPLHRRKRWFRGYNQAAFAAEEFGKRIRLPVASEALIRRRYTRPQMGVDEKKRRDNVRDAFRIGEGWKEKLQGKCVLLMDDIYTTGATLESCAKILRDAGVETIYFASLCTGRDY